MRVHGGNVLDYGEDFLDFSSNLNVFFPKSILEKSFKKISVSHITFHPSVYPFRLQKFIEDLLHLKGSIVVVPGSIYGIHLILQFVRPKRVVIPVPTFNEYERIAKVSGVELFFHRLKEEEAFKLCLGEIASELEEGDLLFVCNPNNPTGGIFSYDEIKGLIRWAEYRNTTLVFDEAFIDFTNLNETARLVEESRRIFILRSFTKFFSVAGLRVGYILAHREEAERMRDFVPSWSIPRFSEELILYLLKSGVNCEVIKKQINREKVFLNTRLDQLNFKVFPSAANFIFIKTPDGVKASWLKGKLLERKIIVRDFPEYKFLEDRFIRISVRKRSDNERLIRNLKEVLE